MNLKDQLLLVSSDYDKTFLQQSNESEPLTPKIERVKRYINYESLSMKISQINLNPV